MASESNSKLGKLPPREKVLVHGFDALNDSELLALLFGNGTKGKNVLDFTTFLLESFQGLHNFANLTYSDLIKISGIKKARALHLLACLELSRRLRLPLSDGIIGTAENIFYYFRPLLIDKCQEHFICVFINSKNIISGYRVIGIGTINAVIINPSDVFREAIRFGAAQIALVHNHPSGDPTPSKEDIHMTQAIFEIGDFLNISVVDHIIIGNEKFASLRNVKKIKN